MTGSFWRALVSLALLAAAGCGVGDSDVELVRGVTVEVDARDNTYDPETTEVAAGTQVKFVNVGRNVHNVIPDSEEHEVLYVKNSELGPGDEKTVRLTEPGTYGYYCSIHGTEKAGMIGTIEVTG